MNRGYVKVWRKVLDSGLIQTPNTLALFMFILLNATHKDIKVGTTTGVVELKRGQYISGLHKLSGALKQSVQQIRTSLNRLENLEIITIKSTNKYSIYTIVNYGIYQDIPEDATINLTNNQQTNNKQVTTKQELKHLSTKEKHNIPKSCDLVPYQEIVNIYHETLPELSSVVSITDKRKRWMKKLWLDESAKMNSLEQWVDYFNYVKTINFLNGNNDRNWKANFEWLVNQTNFLKVVEGNYK